MAQRTQGTQFYLIDPYDNSVLSIPCVTSASGISQTRSNIEVQCLELDYVENLPGMRQPGAATYQLNFDMRRGEHVRLYQLFAESMALANQGIMPMAIGWSDGVAPPTVDSDGFVFPASRSFLQFDGYIADIPFDIQPNAVYQASVQVQLADAPAIIPRAA